MIFPINMFVAGTMEARKMNFIEGTLVGNGQSLLFQQDDNQLTLDADMCERLREKGYAGRSVFMGVRPEDVRIHGEMMENVLRGTVEMVENMGSEKFLYINTGNENISAKVGRNSR